MILQKWQVFQAFDKVVDKVKLFQPPSSMV